MAKQLTEFEKEFAKARADGKTVFDWRGKKYTTERKEEKASRLAEGKGRPYVNPKSREPIKMRTAAEEAADDAKIAEASKKDQSKKSDSSVTPLPPLKKPESKPKTEPKVEVRKAPTFEGFEKIKPSPDPYGRKAPTWDDEPKVKESPKKQPNVWSNPRSGGGGGGMMPDIEKVPGKRPLKMKSGGSVSASRRGDGCAVKGKTRGRYI